LEYGLSAMTTWFLAFFPLTDSLVAIPFGMATGVGPYSVIIWTTLGDLTSILVLHLSYEQLLQSHRIRNWLERFISIKVQTQINRWGIGLVLLLTPWAGVWVMVIAIKVLGLSSLHFLGATFASSFLYTVGFVLLIQIGVDVFI
ncbi:MAG: hypothetical protein ACOYLB_10910, partial [Phototrophicaceae bacterium]